MKRSATLPPAFTSLILTFTCLFSKGTWQHVRVLLVGALLTRGPRTVASALRAMGRSGTRHFQNFHRVLNRAQWNSRQGSHLLLRLLIAAFVPTGPVILGIDDTIERRWGPKIKAKGVYRDPVRSSQSHFVKTQGLRWMSLMLLAPIPWAGRVWALPFLTALAPSERYCQQHRRHHKTLPDWARQMLRQARRWLPDRTLIMVGDGAFSVLELLADLVALPRPIICITRLRLDARLYAPAPKRRRGRAGRPRCKGCRLPSLKQRLADPKTRWQRLRIPNWYGQGPRSVDIASQTAVWYRGGSPPLPIRWVLMRDPKGHFDPQALLCTDLQPTPAQILTWFQMRWQVEVTFQESRAHLGVETQRQWSDRAIARTTPCLFGLFSLVTLLANRLATAGRLPLRQTAWYKKQRPTFADALAAVRTRFWQHNNFCLSCSQTNLIKIPRPLFQQLKQAVCYAA